MEPPLTPHEGLVGLDYAAVALYLVFTFGISQIIRGASLGTFGRDNHSLSSRLSELTLFAGPLAVPGVRLATFAAGFALTLGFLWFLYRTPAGLRIRMVSQDVGAATLPACHPARPNSAGSRVTASSRARRRRPGPCAGTA